VSRGGLSGTTLQLRSIERGSRDESFDHLHLRGVQEGERGTVPGTRQVSARRKEVLYPVLDRCPYEDVYESYSCKERDSTTATGSGNTGQTNGTTTVG
jgi:hypothetical protein